MPKNLSLYNTSIFFYGFFLKIPKNVTFLFFCFASHVFSKYSLVQSIGLT